MTARDFMRTSSGEYASNRSFAKNANNSATQVAPPSRGSIEPILKTGGFNMRGSDLFFPEPNDSISTKGDSQRTRQHNSSVIQQNKVLLKKPKPY